MEQAGEQPVAFTKVLNASYLRGAALQLPSKLFAAHFPETRAVRLRNAAGQEWDGKVSVRRNSERGDSARLEVTSGWGIFAKANNLQIWEEVQIQYVPDGVLLVTVLDPAAATSGTAKAPTPSTTPRAAQPSSSDGLAALAAAAGQEAEQQAQQAEGRQSEQQSEQQPHRKRPRSGEEEEQQQADVERLQQAQPADHLGPQLPQEQQASKQPRHQQDPAALATAAAAAAAAARDAANAAAAAALVAAAAAEEAARAAAAVVDSQGQG